MDKGTRSYEIIKKVTLTLFVSYLACCFLFGETWMFFTMVVFCLYIGFVITKEFEEKKHKSLLFSPLHTVIIVLLYALFLLMLLKIFSAYSIGTMISRLLFNVAFLAIGVVTGLIFWDLNDYDYKERKKETERAKNMKDAIVNRQKQVADDKAALAKMTESLGQKKQYADFIELLQLIDGESPVCVKYLENVTETSNAISSTKQKIVTERKELKEMYDKYKAKGYIEEQKLDETKRKPGGGYTIGPYIYLNVFVLLCFAYLELKFFGIYDATDDLTALFSSWKFTRWLSSWYIDTFQWFSSLFKR